MHIVITGASRGLGKAIALRFAAEGHSLFLSSKNEVALYRALEEIQTAFPGVRTKAFAADLSEKSGVQKLAEKILDSGQPVDILVNNAGSFVPGNVSDEPEGALEEMIQVNLYSAYHLTRLLLPGMISRKRGHIFNLCSVASLKAYANGGAYSISKFALSGFSKNLREEMKPHGIKVTAVYPGATYTDSWAAAGADPARLMEAEDISQLIFSAATLSSRAVVEEIIIRPQLGDL